MHSKRESGATEMMRRIRAEMVARGITCREMAAAIGFSESHVYNVCEGWRKSPEVRAKIEIFLGTRFWSMNKGSDK
jgi:transposase